MAPKLDYEGIKDLAKELGRPVETLVALSMNNDPFYIMPHRQKAARWAADLWHQLKIPTNFHYRGIHYRIISQPEPILTVDGEPYENTLECWDSLCDALKDAHYLGLVPDNAYVENRSDLPSIYLANSTGAYALITNREPDYEDIRMPGLPALTLDSPEIPQPIHLEIFVEKSTQNDILLPIARRRKLNLVTGVGEISATRVREFVDRAKSSKRPVRILYISDFDPAGLGMPISVAVKIQFEIYRQGLDLDVQVRPIALTHEQCKEHNLPRTPIKESERRATTFEDRFGEGATELDALEALHPGLLGRIVEKEIDRYWDPDHDSAVTSVCRRVSLQLYNITSEIHAEHQEEIDALTAEWQQIEASYQAWQEHAKPVWQAILWECQTHRHCLDGVEWVEQFEAEEDPDPLFDSTRDYVDQIDRFKRHQGKLTVSRALRRVACVVCGTAFETIKKDRLTCSASCRRKAQRDPARPLDAAKRPLDPEKYPFRACIICGADFQSRRKDTFICDSAECKRTNARNNEAAYRERERAKTMASTGHGMTDDASDHGSDGGAS